MLFEHSPGGGLPMNKRLRTPQLALASLVAAVVLGVARAEERGLLLHASFDGSIVADSAAGRAEGFQKQPEHSVAYVAGVKGKAVLPRGGGVCYEARGNFSTPVGTIMFWAKPVDWDPGQPSKNWTGFFDAHQRVGRGGEDKLSFWRYPATMSGGVYNYHCAQGDNLDSVFIRAIKGWRKGQWKFLAFTWDESGRARAFADGKPFAGKTRRKDALPVDLNYLSIASSGTAFDELRVFGRVLSDGEIAGWFEDGRESAASATAEDEAPAGPDFPSAPATVCASPLTGAITIDGVLDEAAWGNCVEFRDMSLSTANRSPGNRTSFRVGYTNEALFLGVVCRTRGGKPKVTVRKHGGPVYTDDSIEAFLGVEPGGKEYYQFVANAVAARYEGRGMDGSWDGEWRAAATREKGRWTLEIAIPFASIGVEPVPGKVLGFNLCRNDKSANQSLTWADLGGYAFHRPDHFGRLILGRTPVGAAGVSVVFRKQDRLAARARLRNAGPDATTVRWLVSGSGGGRSFRVDRKLEIAPGGERMVAETSEAGGAKGAVGWRTALWAGGELLYLSPPRLAGFHELPPLLEARAPVVLKNGKVALSFDAFTGAPVSLKNVATGLELRPRAAAQPLFALDAVSFQKHPLFFREDDVISLEASPDSARRCRKQTRPDGVQVLETRHEFKEGVAVAVTIELAPDSEVSAWRIRVENRLPRRPREGLVVHRVAFPILDGLRAAEADREQALAWPKQAGWLVREPARKASALRKIENPGGASMSWVDLSGPKGGLYLAGHDVEPVCPTIFEAEGDAKSGEVGLTIRRWSLLWPQDDWAPAACSVGVHAGDWHWSAERYREWFSANCRVRPTPQWVRDEDAWIMDGGGANRATFADIATTLSMGENMGCSYVQSWQHHMSTEHGEMFSAQMPNVYGGTEKQFIAALRALRKRGGRIGFYFNGTDVEMRAGALLNLPKYRQKFPPDIQRRLPDPDPLADGWLDQCVMGPDGSYMMGWPSPIDHWAACNASKVRRDWVHYWVVEKYARQYKSDTWYQDCSPWIGQGVCFNPRHEHGKPLPRGQALIDLGDRIVKDVGSDFGILGESMCDRLMTYQTHSLWLAGLGVEDSEPALFIYTHPRFPLFCGTCFFFSAGCTELGKHFFHGLVGKPSFADLLRYVLLYGGRFDLFHGPRRAGPEFLNAPQKEERDVIMLRRLVHDELEASDFRDRIGLSGMPEHVEARLFVGRELTGGLITVLDFRKTRTAFALRLDAAAHGLRSPLSAELCLPGGRVAESTPPTHEGAVTSFALPADGEKMTVVRFRTQ